VCALERRAQRGVLCAMSATDACLSQLLAIRNICASPRQVRTRADCDIERLCRRVRGYQRVAVTLFMSFYVDA